MEEEINWFGVGCWALIFLIICGLITYVSMNAQSKQELQAVKVNTSPVTCPACIQQDCPIPTPCEIQSCNTTTATINTTQKYVLSLIQRVKRLEKQHNDSLTLDYEDYNYTTHKLFDCRNELCDYNSSWCY